MSRLRAAALLAVTILSGLALVVAAHRLAGQAGILFWLALGAFWLVATFTARDLSMVQTEACSGRQLASYGPPIVFGGLVLVFWETLTVGAGVPAILLPAPSAVAVRMAAAFPTLAADFVQTFVRSALPGYAIGSFTGFATAVLCDRIPFLRRGLLPIASFASAMPIVGIAPIMVMWFGFDWPSKAAVVAVMTFFPMLISTGAGLTVAGAIERDLMRTYGAGYVSTLLKLRLPAALPFVFNGLKVNATLALIGAIVAEFFGTPIIGMGFRISIEAARMSLDMVWAEIVVAAVAGSLFYGAIVLVEHATTHWDPPARMP